jgi:crotonobetainyl-CoA:carnitine CoA-transferase CaiB-like acyl-CoA transferase
MVDTTTADDPTLPLAGVRIIELSTNVTASLGTMILAEQGAAVIKIEPPGTGDGLRYVGTRIGDTSAIFANCNRGKRSLALDLKSTHGQKIVQSLARDADVLVHNFRHGVMERLNLSSDSLRAANARLIYVGISGYGPFGPRADDPAYDHVMQATTGYTSVQGRDGEREFMRSVICDKITSYTACQAIVAALYARTRTGKGQHISVSMLESSLFFLWPDGMSNHTLLGEDIVRCPPIADIYSSYRTRDGAIAISASTDRHWASVFTLAGRRELIDDPRFSTMGARSRNIPVLIDVLKNALCDRSTAEVLDALRAMDVPCAELLDVDGVLTHPQIEALEAIRILEHPALGRIRAVMPPVRFGGIQARPGSPCPRLGEHTEAILAECGLPLRDSPEATGKSEGRPAR